MKYYHDPLIKNKFDQSNLMKLNAEFIERRIRPSNLSSDVWVVCLNWDMFLVESMTFVGTKVD